MGEANADRMSIAPLLAKKEIGVRLIGARGDWRVVLLAATAILEMDTRTVNFVLSTDFCSRSHLLRIARLYRVIIILCALTSEHRPGNNI